MMKRRLYILLLPLLVFASAVSCSKQEMDTASSIGFGVDTDGNIPTKVTDTSFEGPDIINVLGFLVEDAEPGNDEGRVNYGMPYIGAYSSSTVRPLSFSYSDVTATGYEGGKVYASGYYWPKFDNCEYEALHFHAYYAYNTTSDGITTGPVIQYRSDAAPVFEYNMDIKGQAAKEDFLVASQTASENDVELKFRHTLAKVVLEVKLYDWIGAYDMKWMFDDFVVGATWDCTHSAWIDSDKTISPFSVTSTANVVSFYAIPQTVEEFAVVWNYHKEKITLPTSLTLAAGFANKITLSISRDKVIGVVIEPGKPQQWDTVENTNNLN